ncbi:MAG: sugar phosphate isomerase/epimerase [Verrucomicrobia bacterium]|nr:sugar phosphate isomerase/epimerase [Verrucomicrobiota bacterium]
MKFGINTFLFTFPFTNESTKWFPTFKKWGFDSVEIAVDDPAAIDPTHIRTQLDRAGITCCSVCGAFGPDRDLRGTPEAQANSAKYLMALIDQAAMFGAPVVAGPVYSAVGRRNAEEPAAKKQQWKTVVKNLKPICKYAEKKGIVIAVEPLNRFETDFINTVEQALELIADVGSPALKIHLDTFHMNIEQKNQAEAIKKAGKLLAHFHACGSDRGTPGNDHIAWDEIAKALKKVKYDGGVVIESFTQDVKIIAAAAAIWRQIEPSREEIATKGLKFLRKTLA